MESANHERRYQRDQVSSLVQLYLDDRSSMAVNQTLGIEDHS